jgi:hypothetical protein
MPASRRRDGPRDEARRQRAPATHPDRWSVRLCWQRFQGKALCRVEAADERRTARLPQRAERADRLVEALPSFGEVETDGRVVLRRGARTYCHEQPTTRKTIDRAQRLGDRYRSTHHCERDRRCKRHSLGVLHHRGKRDGSIKPGHGEDHVIVHRQGAEAELRSRRRVGDEMGEGVRMTPEVHQREMSPELDSVPPQPREISTTGRQPRFGATRQYSLRGRDDSVDHAAGFCGVQIDGSGAHVCG